MTDEQIIKALECCTGKGKSCKECPAFVKVDRSKCRQYFIAALELIRRQQKQIDVLNTNCMSMCQSMPNMAKAERVETIKEFAERLKEIAGSSVAVNNGQEIYETKCYNIMAYKLDNLVKEMVGADNAE